MDDNLHAKIYIDIFFQLSVETVFIYITYRGIFYHLITQPLMRFTSMNDCGWSQYFFNNDSSSKVNLGILITIRLADVLWSYARVSFCRGTKINKNFKNKSLNVWLISLENKYYFSYLNTYNLKKINIYNFSFINTFVVYQVIFIRISF